MSGGQSAEAQAAAPEDAEGTGRSARCFLASRLAARRRRLARPGGASRRLPHGGAALTADYGAIAAPMEHLLRVRVVFGHTASHLKGI